MSYSLQFRDVFAAWEFLLDGLVLTLELSAVTMIAGLAIGLGGAAARVYGPRWLKTPVAIYVETIRNTPLLVQIFIVYFGIASIGLRLSAELSAIIALVINMGAYTTEIMRAGIESIGKTQLEAADCLGLSRTQTILHIILLPAIERVYPALSSQFVF